MGVGDEVVEVRQRAEERVHAEVVADVVAVVGLGRALERREPHGVGAERGDVLEAARRPGQVADAVTVGVGE